MMQRHGTGRRTLVNSGAMDDAKRYECSRHMSSIHSMLSNVNGQNLRRRRLGLAGVALVWSRCLACLCFVGAVKCISGWQVLVMR